MPVKLLMTSCQSTTDIVAVHGIDKGIFTNFRNYDLDPEDLARLMKREGRTDVNELSCSGFGEAIIERM